LKVLFAGDEKFSFKTITEKEMPWSLGKVTS
jgi:hypothetical protein